MTPPEDFKRKLQNELQQLRDDIKATEVNTVWSEDYKRTRTEQLNKSIAQKEDEIAGFDKLTHPIVY